MNRINVSRIARTAFAMTLVCLSGCAGMRPTLEPEERRESHPIRIAVEWQDPLIEVYFDGTSDGVVSSASSAVYASLLGFPGIFLSATQNYISEKIGSGPALNAMRASFDTPRHRARLGQFSESIATAYSSRAGSLFTVEAVDTDSSPFHQADSSDAVLIVLNAKLVFVQDYGRMSLVIKQDVFRPCSSGTKDCFINGNSTRQFVIVSPPESFNDSAIFFRKPVELTLPVYDELLTEKMLKLKAKRDNRITRRPDDAEKHERRYRAELAKLLYPKRDARIDDDGVASVLSLDQNPWHFDRVAEVLDGWSPAIAEMLEHDWTSSRPKYIPDDTRLIRLDHLSRKNRPIRYPARGARIGEVAGYVYFKELSGNYIAIPKGDLDR